MHVQSTRIEFQRNYAILHRHEIDLNITWYTRAKASLRCGARVLLSLQFDKYTRTLFRSIQLRRIIATTQTVWKASYQRNQYSR